MADNYAKILNTGTAGKLLRRMRKIYKCDRAKLSKLLDERHSENRRKVKNHEMCEEE